MHEPSCPLFQLLRQDEEASDYFSRLTPSLQAAVMTRAAEVGSLAGLREYTQNIQMQQPQI